MIRRFLLTSVICVGALLLSALYVRAQELVSAKVLSVAGQVEIRRSANDQPQLQPIAFKVADELRAGDTIITGRKGRLVLGLSDGSQAVIAAQTTIVIKDLSQSPRTLFHILRGKTRVQIEKLGGRPNPYRVNTPTAVIAVRGTTFDVLVADDETRVFLHEGQVAVFNLLLPDQPIFLAAGQTTRIRLRRQATNPGAFKSGRNDGDFKPRREEDRSEENRRTADNSRAEPDRRGQTADGRGRNDAGRGGASADGGARVESGRGGFPAGGGARSDEGRRGSLGSGARPGDNSRGGGRRP